jgi:hypothetical protein
LRRETKKIHIQQQQQKPLSFFVTQEDATSSASGQQAAAIWRSQCHTVRGSSFSFIELGFIL